MKKMKNTVNLAPELSQSLVEHPDLSLGPIIDHPLVRLILYTPDQNEYLNDMFKQKQRDLKKSISNKKWDHVLMLHERPWRSWAFAQFAPYMKPIEYWENLAFVYMDTEQVYEEKDMWIDFFNANVKQKRKLMNSKERKVIQNLPQHVTIFRGYNDLENTGHGLMSVSWTLSENLADWFARRFAGDSNALVAEGICKKSNILAYFNRREEEEIVINPLDVNIMDNRSAKELDLEDYSDILDRS